MAIRHLQAPKEIEYIDRVWAQNEPSTHLSYHQVALDPRPDHSSTAFWNRHFVRIAISQNNYPQGKRY